MNRFYFFLEWWYVCYHFLWCLFSLAIQKIRWNILFVSEMLFSFSSRFSCAYIQLRSPISVLLKHHYLVTLLSSLRFYSFSVKEKKILRGKKVICLWQRPLSLHALVSKITCIAKDWLCTFSLLNSWSFKGRTLKMLLWVNVLCNLICNSLTKLNHCYHIRNTHFKVVHRITDLFFKIYSLLRKYVYSIFLFFPPFRSLILGPDFQLSTQDSINISVNCSWSTPLQMKPGSV